MGKYTTALELARIVLDPAGEKWDPDGQTARLIEAGAHPDLHIIRKELALYSDNPALRARKLMNIPLDVLREHLIGGQTGDGRYHEGPAYRTAAMGHGKVFVIDEAELMDQTGQNALLKTLEEPPVGTYVVLITSRPQRLLPTIHSRCQHAQFVPLDDEAMATWFERARIELPAEQRAWITAFCQGSPGIAQIAAEHRFDRWQATLDPMLTALERGTFPVQMGETMAGFVEAFAVEWVKQHDNASKDAANKDGTRFLLSMLVGHANRKLAEAVGHDADPGVWLRVIDLVSAAEQQLYANVNLKLVLENLVVQWARTGAMPEAAQASQVSLGG